MAGYSAGAHLALVAGTSCKKTISRTECPQMFEPVVGKSLFERPLLSQHSRPDAVIAESGLVDFVGQTRRSDALGETALALMGCRKPERMCSDKVLRAADPRTFLDSSDPPTYFAYSPGDAVVDPSVHALPVLPRLTSVLGPKRLWVDGEESPSAGRWLDLLPAAQCLFCPGGDGVPEYVTYAGHDTNFLNASMVAEFLERVRTKRLK